MGRSSCKYWKFIVHVICIIITAHCVNERLNYKIIIKFERHSTDIKHILIWTDLPGVQQQGQTHFIKKKCSKINCYFTKNRTLFGDVRYFDAIVFNAVDLKKDEKVDIPSERGVNQVYIFASNDSADKNYVCNPIYDGFFNWTWTYRQDSTIPYRFISIYNNRSEELGSHFPWPIHTEPINPTIKSLFATKSKGAAALLDECKSNSNREGFIQNLQKAMAKYNLTLDVFGNCGTKQCKRRSFGACNWRLKNQYFFYLALEDSIDHDFVTNAVLRAYKNNVVPVVYGGANYNHYLPPHSYIDAIKLGIPETAKIIYESIKNREQYYEFFKWRNHYQVRASTPLDACALCKKFAELQLKGRTSYDMIRKWWLPKYAERCWIDSLSKETPETTV
ncbi:alpha-(1,3)-fucosyltransferase C-like [Cydia strobilella]|uniref:alpha-(1,3)-fucosyltransferase C-like n=1 Tax=Cydia strobilella TaxID=1100964 RepID=UPI003004C1A0